jgi:hypothetical protein
MNNTIHYKCSTRYYQSGVVTIFTGVMMLVLLTLMIFFAMRVGVFEQRVSSNEMRQKLAFHAAESGIHHAKEYLRANSALVASDTVGLLENGSDGWLVGQWRRCDGDDAPGINLDKGQTGDHPCFAESREYPTDSGEMRRKDMFYYSNDLTATDETVDTWRFPVDTTGSILPGSTEIVDVFALLCILEVHEGEEVPVKGCVTDITNDVPDDGIVTDGTYFMVTLLARGQADCIGSDCKSEALISEHVSNFGAAAGGRSPAVPLTVKSTFMPSGTIGVVANPNAGGIGVPATVWMNDNPECSGGNPLQSKSGSWETCEMNEWYETYSIPEGVACTQGPCQCEKNEALSYTSGSADVWGIDLIADIDFPCDLFQFYFGVSRANYETVKGYSKIITSCAPLVALGKNANGIYWVSGEDCTFGASDIIGSPETPVLLITAATTTKFGGGATIFGSVFATDVEKENAEIVLNGTGAIYGALIVESGFSSSNSSGATFDIVWNENISKKAGTSGGLGNVLGGWSDFHQDWTFEQE